MIHALRDDVIVKLVVEEHKGMIEIPKSASKWRQYDSEVFGEVVAVGSKSVFDLKPGDKINFQRHEGKRFYYEGQQYLKLKARWVMAKVEG